MGGLLKRWKLRIVIAVIIALTVIIAISVITVFIFITIVAVLAGGAQALLRSEHASIGGRLCAKARQSW